MAFFAVAIPILPGKTEQWRQFANEIAHGRWSRDFAESRRRLGVHERTFFQSTPMGDFVIVTLEGDDPAGAFQRFASGNDEFTRWFLQQVKEVHGLDLTQPMSGGFPELVVDTRRGGLSAR